MKKKKATKKKPATTRTLSARSSKKIADKAKRKPGFEAALEAEAQAAELQRIEEDQAPSQLAPGAEEHPDFAEPAKLPDKTYPGLVPVLKIPFSIWANIKKMPEIRLSDEEADEWGLPVTQLIEYYFPGKIPEIAWVWLMFLSSTGKVIDSRVDMIHEKTKSVEGPTGPVTSVSSAGAATPVPGRAPAHDGAEVKEDFPQE